MPLASNISVAFSRKRLSRLPARCGPCSTRSRACAVARLPLVDEYISGFPSPRGRGSDEQVCSLYLEGCRQPVDHVDARGINAALERTDVGSINLRSMRELFLRQPCCAPISPQVPRENLPNVHAWERSGLSSILPRSILYNPTPRASCWCDKLTTRRRHRVRLPLARSQARQAPALNVIHFIVVTDAMSWICILMHDGARSDA